MNEEIFTLTPDQIEKLKKSFSTVTIKGEVAHIKDWLDDSIQTIPLKK